MKKKIWVIIICLILVLFIPIPTGVYKDGGTKTFTALTYKIVNWNHLTADGGVYKKLKIYPFPMNFFSLDHLLSLEQKNFPKENSSSEISTSSKEETSSEMPSSSEHKPLNKYEPQFIRTNGYVPGAFYPRKVLISNRSELNEYYEKRKDYYDLKKFKESTSGYDESFFKNNKLVMIVLEEGSGSIRHEVNYAKSGGSPDIEKLQVKIERIIPEAMTADMAVWHILITTDAKIHTESDINLTISQKNENAAEKTVTINYDNGKIGSKKIYTFSNDYASKLTSILKNLRYDKSLCKCYPEYTITTENGTYGVKIDGEGYARINGAQADLSGDNFIKVKEILTWAMNKAEPIYMNSSSVKEKP